MLHLSRHHRSPVWTYYQTESQIPTGSRTLRVLLIATRYVGSDNDGYFDDLCLEVDTNAPDVFVTVTPEGGVAEVAVGSTLQLYATTTGEVDSAYIWSSSFEAVATVDDSGLVTAHLDGRVTIQAEGTSTHAVGYLEIVAYSPNYVIFTHPQSEEEWEGGTNQNITWELVGNIESGTLHYSTTGGSEWIEIEEIPDLAVQQYSWLVPDTDEILNDCMFKMVWDGGEATSSVFRVVGGSTNVEEQKDAGALPKDFSLSHNFPNPFNPATEIRYQLPQASEVQIAIYNLLGQEVRRLVDGPVDVGYRSVLWDGRDSLGREVGSGVYLVQMKAKNFVQVRKMVKLQ